MKNRSDQMMTRHQRLLFGLVLLFIGVKSHLAHAATLVGEVRGVFTNPIGGSQPEIVGANSPRFQWGRPFVNGTRPNLIAFEPIALATQVESVFPIGTISFFNGTIHTLSGIDKLSLELTFDFEGAPETSFQFPFSVVGTPNTDFAIDSADFLELDRLRSEKPIVLNDKKYQLIIWFDNPGFGAFTQGDGFAVLEDIEAKAEVWGTFTQNEANASQLVESQLPRNTPTSASMFSSRWKLAQEHRIAGALEIDIGDYNGDQWEDLLVITSQSLRLFKGDGKGHLEAKPTIRFSGNQIRGDFADLDGDGNRDIALLGNKITIWLNDGTGNFVQSSAEFSGTSVGDLVVGDIDNDTDQDIVVGLGGDSLLVSLVNDGVGNFSISQTVPAKELAEGRQMSNLNIELGDFDSDGDLDLGMAQVVTSVFDRDDTSFNSIWHNNGKGEFDPTQPDLSPSTDGQILIAQSIIGRKMGVGDIDHDGDIDLLIPGGGLLVNSGDGLFRQSIRGLSGQFVHRGSATVVHIEDFDGDGRDDMLSDTSRLGFELDPSSRIQFPTTLHLANSTASFVWAQSFSRQKVLAVATGDLNGDSKRDIALATDQSIEVWLRGIDRSFPTDAFELIHIDSRIEREVIASTVGKPSNQLTRFDLATVFELNFNRRGLKSLNLPTGLINLRSLDVSNNSITELDLPDDIKKLDSLNFTNPSGGFQSGVRSVRLGSGFKSITSLGLLGLGIQELILDVEMPALTTVSLWGNRMTNFSFLEKTPNLEILNLGDNRLTELTLPLGPRNLKDLTLGMNAIRKMQIPSGMEIDRVTGFNRNNISFYTPPARLLQATLHDKDALNFQIESTDGEWVIEGSNDLKTWTEIDRVSVETWKGSFTAPIAPGPGLGFFRVVQP